MPGPLHPCPHSYLLLQAQNKLWEEKYLLGHLSECLAAPAASGFQQRLQPHGGKPGCPVTAEHWDWARRLSWAGAEMLTTGFGPLCPWGMGVLQKKEPWPLDSPSPGLAAGMGETLGDGELGEQRCWDVGMSGFSGSSHLQMQRSLSILHPARPQGMQEQGATGTQPTVHPQPHSWHAMHPTHDASHSAMILWGP